MAFDRDNFTGSVNDGLFIYNAGADTKADLQVSGYFGNRIKDGSMVQNNDLIIARCSDGLGLFMVTDGSGDIEVSLEME
jgi:hypothetical protein